MPRPKGLPKTGGRKPGSVIKKTREIAELAIVLGITPLEVQLGTMREYWRRATQKDEMDVEWADKACQIASACAPYIHPRLASIEMNSRTEIDLTVSRQELIERARREIEAAFKDITPLKPLASLSDSAEETVATDTDETPEPAKLKLVE